MNKSILAVGLAVGMCATVAQAGILDLSNSPTDSGWLNGAFFTNEDPVGSQGTGVFEPFVRIQGTGQGSTQEGYNTDGAFQFDEKGGVWTHSVLFSNMGFFTCAGGFNVSADCDPTKKYYLYILDLNENVPGGLLSVDDIEIYEMNNASPTNYSAGADWANRLFDLGAGNSILLDYNVTGTGSGGGDFFAYIPLPDNTLPQMVMYSKFGGLPNAERDAGFEEWAFSVGPGCQIGDPACDGGNLGEVPEPSTMLLMGGALLGLGLIRKKRNS